MTKGRRTNLMLLSLLAIALSGCTALGRDTRRQAEDVVLSLPATWAAPTGAGPVSMRLLDLVDDDRLRELVAEALEANHDLRAAGHRLAASRLLLAETRAPRSPSVAGGVLMGRGNQGFDELGQMRAATRHRISLDVSWEVDLWRRLADLHDANAALAESEAVDLAAARDALGARVIQAWLAAVSLRQAMTLQEGRVEILERLQDVTRRRYRRGVGSLDDLAAARSGTEQALAEIVRLREELEDSHRVLELLLGRTPGGWIESEEALPAVVPPGVGLPAAVIAGRHDVTAAFLRLQAADASAAAAAKALFPSLRLTGDLFKDGAAISGLAAATTVWSVVGSLTQPIFQRGLLKARSEARLRELEAAWEDYRGVVLGAFGEVEAALGRERSLVRQREHLRVALRESVRSRDVFEGRYRAGLASVLEFLQAEDQRMEIEGQLIALDGEILSSRITLALALGAGFEELER